MDLADHHRLICRELEKIVSGNNRRLIIAAPPGSAKTTYVSRLFPAYYLGRFPSSLVITASHSASLAHDNSSKVRDIISSRKYTNIFSGTQIDKNSRAKERWSTTAQGEYFAIGVEGGVSGKRADLIVIDDPFKTRADAYSDKARKTVSKWFAADIYTRQRANASIVIIATRWHPEDLSGELIKKSLSGKGEEWKIINIEAICTNEERDVLGRKVGEPYWPKNFPLEEMLKMKNMQSVEDWESLFQQNPVDAAGGLIKKDMFQWYNPNNMPGPISRITQSWDTAGTKQEKSNPSVCTTWAQVGYNHYLLDVFSGRLEFPELLKQVKYLGEKYCPNSVLVENKGSGIQILQSLKGLWRFPTIGINPEAQGNKIFRFDSVSPMFSDGRVFLPGDPDNHSQEIKEYIYELLVFPNGSLDDQVDSTSQYLSWASPKSKTGMLRLRG